MNDMVTQAGRLGDALRSVRKASGLTLEQLAQRAGTAPSYLGRVERGERSPSSEWVDSITRALGKRFAEGLTPE
jgi:transcriptional regulator with XRE-family HTH domain